MPLEEKEKINMEEQMIKGLTPSTNY